MAVDSSVAKNRSLWKSVVFDEPLRERHGQKEREEDLDAREAPREAR